MYNYGMDRTKVLLLFGGESSEHDVSLSSARNVYGAIDKDQYDVTPCYIGRDGKWWQADEIREQSGTDSAEQLLPVLGTGRFMTHPGHEEYAFDVILPILHGRNGEDGTVQGLAQLAHVPIVGCDVTASAATMNKLACKQILSASGISVIPYRAHREYEATPSYDDIVAELGEVVFVKPARAGSSVGVSKVENEDQFAHALQEAHRHDPIALIEKAIVGQELEVAVLGTPPTHEVSGVGEIIPGDTFYSYDDKYAPESKAQVLLEAGIDHETKETIRSMAASTYEALGCSGLARVDFLRGNDGELYVLEVNTMPGFTNISMYPKLWQQEGVGYTELISRLIDSALHHA